MAKILVVDDDRSLLRALNLGLQSGGHDVIVAVDGASGLACWPWATPPSRTPSSPPR